MMPVARPPVDVLGDETARWLQRRVDSSADLEPDDKRITGRWNAIHAPAAARHKQRIMAALDATFAARCAYCERAIAKTIDHVRPKSLFPRDMFRWDGFSLACRDCNTNKQATYTETADGVPNVVDPTGEDPGALFDWDIDPLDDGVHTGQVRVVDPEARARVEATREAFDLDHAEHCRARQQFALTFGFCLVEIGRADVPDDVTVKAHTLMLAMLAVRHPYRSVFRHLVRRPALAPLIDAACAAVPELRPLIDDLDRPLHHPDYPPARVSPSSGDPAPP